MSNSFAHSFVGTPNHAIYLVLHDKDGNVLAKLHIITVPDHNQAERMVQEFNKDTSLYNHPNLMSIVGELLQWYAVDSPTIVVMKELVN